MPDYSINFLPEKLAGLDFYQYVCQLIDWSLTATADDDFLEIPTEFIDLIGTYDDEEAVLAYYNSSVKPAIGTAWLMDTLLSMFEAPYTMTEWFEYAGDSFKFRVSGTGTAVTVDDLRNLRALLIEYKNERSVLEYIDFVTEFTETVDATVVDTSLGGDVLQYEKYDGDNGGGASSFVYDGSDTYGPIATTPWTG